MYEHVIKQFLNLLRSPIIEEIEQFFPDFHHPHAEQLNNVGTNPRVHNLHIQPLLNNLNDKLIDRLVHLSMRINDLIVIVVESKEDQSSIGVQIVLVL